jgi:hypothetical protein
MLRIGLFGPLLIFPLSAVAKLDEAGGGNWYAFPASFLLSV